MIGRASRAITYGVFVRFRRSKLRLRRGIARLEDAMAIAESLRRERLDGGSDVFVARESDGAVVDPPALTKTPSARATKPRPARPHGARVATLSRVRAAEARATAATERLDRIVDVITAEIDRAPPAMQASHARVIALRDMAARTLASFVGMRSRMEKSMGDEAPRGAGSDTTPPAPV